MPFKLGIKKGTRAVRFYQLDRHQLGSSNWHSLNSDRQHTHCPRVVPEGKTQSDSAFFVHFQKLMKTKEQLQKDHQQLQVLLDDGPANLQSVQREISGHTEKALQHLARLKEQVNAPAGVQSSGDGTSEQESIKWDHTLSGWIRSVQGLSLDVCF